jgi:hypothetical protein
MKFGFDPGEKKDYQPDQKFLLHSKDFTSTPAGKKKLDSQTAAAATEIAQRSRPYHFSMRLLCCFTSIMLERV